MSLYVLGKIFVLFFIKQSMRFSSQVQPEDTVEKPFRIFTIVSNKHISSYLLKYTMKFNKNKNIDINLFIYYLDLPYNFFIHLIRVDSNEISSHVFKLSPSYKSIKKRVLSHHPESSNVCPHYECNVSQCKHPDGLLTTTQVCLSPHNKLFL